MESRPGLHYAKQFGPLQPWCRLGRPQAVRRGHRPVSAGVELKPDHIKAHNSLAVALAAQGRLDEAMVHCREVLKIEPDDDNAHLNLALALARRGRLDEAIAHYQQGMKTRPDDADAHYNFGVALAGRGRFDEAIGEFQQARKAQTR